MQAASIAPVVQGWGARGAEVIVWDRARGHHGAAYQEVPVKLVEQPPYSPQLNPAERIFESLRGEVEGKEASCC
jgi:transposase